MELIIILIVFFVVKNIKQAGEGQANQAKKRGSMYQTSNTTNQYKQAIRENIEKARQMAQASPREIYEQLHVEEFMSKQRPQQNIQENHKAKQQVQASRMEARNTSILQRAKANAEEDKVDVTLQTMEAEHNHSERVSAAVHHHPEDIMPENMLGNIEDLMIKGYDGNLCFERDFLGEAMDMISRFTVPSDVPDYSKKG